MPLLLTDLAAALCHIRPELNAHGNEDDMMGVALPARPTGGAGLRSVAPNRLLGPNPYRH